MSSTKTVLGKGCLQTLPFADMLPTCNCASRSAEDDGSNHSKSHCSKQRTVHLYDDDLYLSDPGPFYGMLDRREEDEEEEEGDSRFHVRLTSPRRSGSIPGASETFQRVMRQLDDVPELCEEDPSHSTATARKPPSSKPERKPSKKVKKSASFSASASHSSTSSSSCETSSPSGAGGGESKRRMSVPCMRSSKHVQWVDEAGVSNLVSVRLIRPRLIKNDKEVQEPTPSRSILRRLSGMR